MRVDISMNFSAVKHIFSVVIVIFVLMMSGCGFLSQKSGSSEPSSSVSASGAGVTGEQIEREFREITKGTIEAAGSDPSLFKFGDGSAFSFEEFDSIDPAVLMMRGVIVVLMV